MSDAETEHAEALKVESTATPEQMAARWKSIATNMSDPLPDARRQEIRERCEKASPGEWKCWNAWSLSRADVAIHRIGPADSSLGGIRGYTGQPGHGDGDLYASRDDAQFVAHARTDIPALLAEVDRLKAENTRWEERTIAILGSGTLNDLSVDEAFAYEGRCVNQLLAALRSQVERLTQENERLKQRRTLCGNCGRTYLYPAGDAEHGINVCFPPTQENASLKAKGSET